MKMSDLLAEKNETDDLRAIPIQYVDPIRRTPENGFRIMRAGQALDTIPARKANTPEQAIAYYIQREAGDRMFWNAATPRAPLPSASSTPARKVTSHFEVVSDPASIESTDEPDDFYYHVTSRPAAILRNGLAPNQRPSMDAGFYRDYSSGKAFLCDRPGVPYWIERISQHLATQYERPSKLSVVRIPKRAVSRIETDELGSRDSHAPSYFTRGRIQ